MSTRNVISRKDFLHGIFRSVAAQGDPSSPRQGNGDETSPEPDYLSMLPPEFSGVMLDLEAARIGGDTAGMSRNEMAALVVKAMYGEDALNAQGRRTPGSAQEGQRKPPD